MPGVQDLSPARALAVGHRSLRRFHDGAIPSNISVIAACSVALTAIAGLPAAQPEQAPADDHAHQRLGGRLAVDVGPPTLDRVQLGPGTYLGTTLWPQADGYRQLTYWVARVARVVAGDSEGVTPW